MNTDFINRDSFQDRILQFHKEQSPQYKNSLMCPNFFKVEVSSCINAKFEDNKNAVPEILESLWIITGQKPTITFSRKSVSEFKIRKGMPVGARLTLRKKRMIDFLERLIRIYLPRSKDFNGFSKKSINDDGLSIGIKDLSIFPEVDSRFHNLFKKAGLSISISIRKRDNNSFVSIDEKIKILQYFDFPIKT